MQISDAKSDAATSCPACGGSAAHLLSAIDRNRRTTKEIFEYFSCSKCGLVFMESPPEDMSPYYQGGYEPIPESLSAMREIAALEHYRSDPILKYRKSGRFLEIGPWRGVFCCLMKDAGFDATAIEMNGPCVDFLRDTLGVEAIQSSNPLETMREMEAESYDAIAAWHSMEHLPTPWLVIQQAARLLKPGGVLLLAMPNPESFEFSVLKSRWMHLDAPRHLYLFPIHSLEKYCRSYGLKLQEVTTSDVFSDIQSWHTWRTLTRSWIPVIYIRGILERTAGKALHRLTRRWQKTEGRGSAYCAIFVRS